MIQKRVQIIQYTPEAIQFCSIASDCAVCKNQCALSQKIFMPPNYSIPNALNKISYSISCSAQVPQEATIIVSEPTLIGMAFYCYGLPLFALFAGSLGAMFAGYSDMICAAIGFAMLFLCQVYAAGRMKCLSDRFALTKECS